jgi:hypothetical protein
MAQGWRHDRLQRGEIGRAEVPTRLNGISRIAAADGYRQLYSKTIASIPHYYLTI